MNRRLVMLVSLAALALSGCGSSNRMLTSIAISPASTQAPDPTAGVQFTATGSFDHSPMTVKPLPVLWVANEDIVPPAGTQTLVTIDGNGVAHCNGYKGGVTIIAYHSPDPNIPIGPQGASTLHPVMGTAKLTCK